MHVGITQELKENVNARINNNFKQKAYRLEFGCDRVRESFTLPIEHSVVPSIVWGKHEHLRELMPANWCKETRDDIGINVKITTVASGKELSIRITLRNKAKKVFLLPPRFDHYTTYAIDDISCPEIKAFFDLAEREQEFNAKWAKIANDVRAFLQSVKSLNAALKAWPELQAYIPPTYLERVDRKADRKSEREQVTLKLAEIDREGAVTAATMVTLAA